MNMSIHSPFDKLKISPNSLKKKPSAEENPSMFTAVIGLATRRLDVLDFLNL
ncbi:MAG: hypothetical protein CM1200mP13_11310 [Candidatus Pelagibacterales bacterium]|nr:MAG: hypothetical protein CM1200mP13_11310 [Pelagibacterales bacterium]